MTRLQSLGLAGAKKAIRNLFRRTLPADEAVNDDPSPALTSTPPASSDPTSTSTSSPSPSPSLPPSSERKDEVKDKDEDRNTLQQESATAATAATTKTTEETTKTNDGTMTPPLAALDHVQQQQDQQHHPHSPLDEDKENQPPVNHLDAITKQLDILTFNRRNGLSTKPSQSASPEPQAELAQDMSIFNDPVIMAERAKHLEFIGEALDMARLALKINETPVGCVLVHDGKVIARGMNSTNVTRNGTRHAEFMALSALLSYPPPNTPLTKSLQPHNISVLSNSQPENTVPDTASDTASENDSRSNSLPCEPLFFSEGNEDGSKGHLYPYGQKLYPATHVDPKIIRECTLYVTVEPCVMCASLLRQLGIKKVYFGAVNDKFGGTGGVFSIHANSLPIGADGQTESAHPQPKPIQYPDGGGSLGTSFPSSGGDGGNVEPGYEIEGGWGRDEAVGLLRRFYVQENGRAPIPRKKEGRAARLAAMMEKDGLATFSESNEEQEQNSDRDDDEDDVEGQGRDDHDIQDAQDDEDEDDQEQRGETDYSMNLNDSLEKENVDPQCGRDD